MQLGKFVPCEMKTSVIKVYSYHDKVMTGLLMNPYFEQEQCFNSLTELLLLLDQLYNELHFPQEAMECRSFNENCHRSVGKPGGNQTKRFAGAPLATFKINVLFRYHASWQGSVVLLEKSLETQFRSVLELILLMDSELREETKETVYCR